MADAPALTPAGFAEAIAAQLAQKAFTHAQMQGDPAVLCPLIAEAFVQQLALTQQRESGGANG